jgi:hypothetical protein
MVNFIGGIRGTWRKPLTYRKSLTNFIIYCCTKYTSPWAGINITTCVDSSNKIDHHDITEILLKVALNTLTLTLKLCYLSGWHSHTLQMLYLKWHVVVNPSTIRFRPWRSPEMKILIQVQLQSVPKTYWQTSPNSNLEEFFLFD